MTDFSFDRQAAVDGIKTVFPLAVPGIPFGLVLGLVITTENIDPLAGWSSSWLMMAGASQLAALNLIADGTSAAVIIVTVLLINSRHAMYSAALRPKFSGMPAKFRLFAPYLLIDQTFAIADTAPELEGSTLRYRMWHFLGTGALVWSLWQISVALGIFVGDVVREEWSLTFAVPLLFTGLLALSVKSRPGVVAAVVAGFVAVAGRDLPQGSGLLLAIVLGVFAAGLADSQLNKAAAE